MFSTKAIAFCIPLLAAVSAAGEKEVTFRVAGKTLAAYFSVYGWEGDWWKQAGASVYPTSFANGQPAYYVYWSTYASIYDQSVSIQAGGLVPRSVVKTEQNKSLTLDVDISTLMENVLVDGYQCVSGSCYEFMPGSFPLKGTFTISQGPASYSERLTGSLERKVKWEGNASTTELLTGNRSRYSANFSGRVGDSTVTPPSYASNAELSISDGQDKITQVYPSRP
jgi:hypothetical protein